MVRERDPGSCATMNTGMVSNHVKVGISVTVAKYCSSVRSVTRVWTWGTHPEWVAHRIGDVLHEHSVSLLPHNDREIEARLGDRFIVIPGVIPITTDPVVNVVAGPSAMPSPLRPETQIGIVPFTKPISYTIAIQCMNRETSLGIVILLVVLGGVIVALAVPGVFAEPEPDRPGHLGIEEVTITPGPVSGASATLSVTTVLRHRGGQSENVTIRVRAIDADSGLVETTAEQMSAPITGNREARTTLNISVARDGGYRIESIVYQDDRRIGVATKLVRGVGTLQPEHARTPVEFHRFDGREGLPPIQFSVQTTHANRTTLAVTAYLTNQGDRQSEDLQLEFIARQADSNIVAARTTMPVGSIDPGRTATPESSITVPANYNYVIDAILWKGGVIVSTARTAANLNPQERITANTTVRDVGIEVSDFETDNGDGVPPERTVMPERTGTPGQSGFGFLALLAAGTLGLLVWRERK